ncbi:MAG: hypothetical protein AAF438_10130 [Pseudomonadota bacterium]
MKRNTPHKDAANRLLHYTERSNAIHRQYLDDTVFFSQYDYFVNWQIEYTRPFYEDLLSKADYRDALDFVITDLIGVGISKRDQDLARVVPMMTKVLPTKALDTVAAAMELNARTLEINARICRGLFQNSSGEPDFSEREYLQGCRATSELEEYLELIALTAQVGESLGRVTRIPMIGFTLRAMRSPAKLSGFGHLQTFLEQGYRTFRKIKQVDQFLVDINERMIEIFTQIYTGPLPE